MLVLYYGSECPHNSSPVCTIEAPQLDHLLKLHDYLNAKLKSLSIC